ncbi:MAG TPA: carbohydrate kinase family protein [Actinomycetota bacterium]|nr:carbohydrate kinase family protein [Actinomycetota bacterium]
MPDLDVLVLGDANPDLVLRGGDLVPVFGQQEQLVDEAILAVGGSGAIFACAAARLGLHVGICGVVGNDPFGRFMREELTEAGVDVRGLTVDPTRPTGVTVVLSRPDDRAMLTAAGTIAGLSGASVSRDLLRDARHVHVSSYFLQDALRPDLPELLDEAHAAGATTSVDPNWDPAENWDSGLLTLLPAVDIFLPNSAEARNITGIDDIDVACESLAGRGGLVAIKFGDGGGMVQKGDEAVRVPGITVDVVDTTGAGDTFDAAFLAAWLEGWPPERALALANVCGAMSCRAAGGTAALPTKEEALERLPEIVGRAMPP